MRSSQSPNQTRRNRLHEVTGGLTTFFSAAYLVVLMPSMLKHIGMEAHATFVAVCVCCFLGTLLISYIAKLPIALGPGVATIAYFSIVVVGYQGITWQEGVTVLLIASIGLLLFTAMNWQRLILNALPPGFSQAICAGIGLFIICIGLSHAHILNTSNGLLNASWGAWTPRQGLFIASTLLLVFLDQRRIAGAFLLTIIVATVLSLYWGYTHFMGAITIPTAWPHSFFSAKWHYLQNPKAWQFALSLFFITLFDNTGTSMALVNQIPSIAPHKKKKMISKAILANAISCCCAGLLATPCTSSYLESAAGIRSGAKTGTAARVVAICFLLTLFFYPLLQAIPREPIAAILVYIGCLMLGTIRLINWKSIPTAFAVITTAAVIPMTYSIAVGLGAGLIIYTLLSLSSSTSREAFHRQSMGLTVCLCLYLILKYYSDIIKII